jgi:SynChlorMet cassette radical SAM/SPASM protein ScmF
LNSDFKNERRLPPLRSIYFYLTEGCNLACRHCWIAPKFDAEGTYPTLPIDLFETAIREAKPLGLQIVKLTGGEPLMHPDFINLLEIIRQEGLGLTIETNGVLCTSEKAAEIAKSKNRSVSVSFDGANADTHEWVRGVVGSFKNASQGVKNLVDAGIRPQIIMTIMRKNLDQVEAVVRMAENLGAGSVKFNFVQPVARGGCMDEDETLNIEEIIRMGQYIEEDLARMTKLPLILGYPQAFRSLKSIAKDKGGGRCGILNIIGVISSGHYALCGIGNHIPELIFGVVGKDDLQEIWRTSSVINELRNNFPGNLDGVCGRCILRFYCQGYCVANNYYRSRNLGSSFWLCDLAEKAGLFPGTRLIQG